MTVVNDLMNRFLQLKANVRPGMRCLDIAGGTGDISRLLAKDAGITGQVWLTDINGSMLGVSSDRLLDEGLMLPVAHANAPKTAIPVIIFNIVRVAFSCAT